jgi:hypothetical protein
MEGNVCNYEGRSKGQMHAIAFSRNHNVRRCVPKVLSVGVFGGKVSVAPPLLVAPPNRSPRQRLYTPSPVKELPKHTGGLRRLPPLDLGGRGPETTHEG